VAVKFEGSELRMWVETYKWPFDGPPGDGGRALDGDLRVFLKDAGGLYAEAFKGSDALVGDEAMFETDFDNEGEQDKEEQIGWKLITDSVPPLSGDAPMEYQVSFRFEIACEELKIDWTKWNQGGSFTARAGVLVVEVEDSEELDPDPSFKLKGQDHVYTVSSGKCEVDLSQSGVFQPQLTIEWQAPYQAKSYSKGSASAGRQRTAKLTKAVLKAEIAKPTPSQNHTWFVNLPQKPSTHAGQILPVDVLIPGGGASEQMYIKVTPDPQKCSLRTDVDLGLVNEDIESFARDPQGETTGILRVADGKDAFKVQLGPAGGCKFTVAVGTTPACTDQSFTVETQRKLYLQVSHPAGVDPSALVKSLNKTFKPGGVIFESFKTLEVTPEQHGDYFYDAAWFVPDGKGHVCHVGEHNYSGYHQALFKKEDAPVPGAALHLGLVHACVTPESQPTSRTAQITPEISKTAIHSGPWKGGPSAHYYETLSYLTPEPLQGKERTLTPSWSDSRGGPWEVLDESHVDFPGCVEKTSDTGVKYVVMRVRVKLPDEAKELLDQKKTLFLKLVERQYDASTGGFTTEGSRELVFGPDNNKNYDTVLGHEVGHVLTMTPLVAITGLGAHTHSYDSIGSHRGPHCATDVRSTPAEAQQNGIGLNDHNAALAAFRVGQLAVTDRGECRCLMFGCLGEKSPRTDFCEQCVKFLRHSDLSVINNY
jgi:hypothetical protein